VPRSSDARRAIIDALGLVRRAQREARKGARRLSRLAGRIEGSRQMLVTLETLDLVLERIALRLNTLLMTGVITRDLIAPVSVLVKELYQQSQDLGPSISQALSELDDILESLAAAAPASEPFYRREEELRDEARSIILEARREAERRLGQAESLGA